MARRGIFINHTDSDVIVLNANFEVADLPDINISKDSKNYTRFVLYPLERLKFKEVSRSAVGSEYDYFPRVSSYYKFTNNRTSGTYRITMQIFEGTIDNLVAVGDESTTYYTGSHSEPELCRGYDWHDSGAIDMANEMLSAPHIVTYNGKQYFCIRYRFVASSYSGTFVGLSCYLYFYYDDNSLIFNGSSNITSAYLGSTKLNGIYLGSNKLL